MRLLHVVPSYLPAVRYGGPVFAVHALCSALAKRGCDVAVFTTNVDGHGESAVPLGVPGLMDGVNVRYFRSHWLRRLYYSSAMARALHEQCGSFDAVHLHSVFLWPTWAAARAAFVSFSSTARRRAATRQTLDPLQTDRSDRNSAGSLRF